MTDPQHLQQLIQVEETGIKDVLGRIEEEAKWLSKEISSEWLDEDRGTQLFDRYLNRLKHHLTRRDTLRELLNK